MHRVSGVEQVMLPFKRNYCPPNQRRNMDRSKVAKCPRIVARPTLLGQRFRRRSPRAFRPMHSDDLFGVGETFQPCIVRLGLLGGYMMPLATHLHSQNDIPEISCQPQARCPHRVNPYERVSSHARALRWANLRCGLLAVFLLVASHPATAAIYDLAIGDAQNRSLRLNIPDSVSVVHGIIIVGNGAGGDVRSAATNAEMVALAESMDFAIIGTAYWTNFSTVSVPNELATFEAGLEQLATTSGHVELVRAPWLPIGHSNGGQMSYGLNALRPEKVIGMVVSKGGFYNITRPGAAALQTPGLLIAGEVDSDYRITAIRDLFFGNRPRGVLWSWVEDQGLDHDLGNSDELTLPFVAAMVQLRYPAGASPAINPVALLPLNESDGWLTDPNSYKTGLATIAPRASYPGDATVAGWLPNRRFSYLFRAFASYNKASATATLDTGAGPVAWGTRVTYTISAPVAPWAMIEYYEGDALVRRVLPGEAMPLAVDYTPVNAGYSVFHALVTFANSVQRTTVPRRVFVRTGTIEAPVIITQPASQTVPLSSSITFTTAVSGSPTPTFQWKRDGITISGATDNTFTLANVTTGDAGAYTVTATNSAGSTSSNAATLTVIGAPNNAIITITVQ